MKKLMSMLVLVALVVFGSWCQAEETIVTARPGALVSYYSVPAGGKLSADAVPLNVSIDTQDIWSQSNLRSCADMEAYAGRLGVVVWEGYLRFPVKGDCVFSLAGKGEDDSVMSVWIDGQKLLEASCKGGGSAKGLAINGTDYVPARFVITNLNTDLGWCGGRFAAYTLKYWLKDKPLKKYVLTPAMMFHKE